MNCIQAGAPCTLYAVRRLLRRGAEGLTPLGRARLQAALNAGDPNGEVALAWHCAQQLRAVYQAKTPAEGGRCVRQVLQLLAGCPIPEIARLRRTLLAWRSRRPGPPPTTPTSSPATARRSPS